MATELGRQIKLWTLVLVFLGISKLGSSAESFMVPIASDLGPEYIKDLSRDVPICGHPLESLMMGLWTLQYTTRNIYLTTALSWILAIFSSVTNGRMTSLLPRAENIWVRQHHSVENRSGCCEEMGDFELPWVALCNVSAAWLFNDYHRFLS